MLLNYGNIRLKYQGVLQARMSTIVSFVSICISPIEFQEKYPRQT